MELLAGRAGVVTGAGQGIGAAICDAFVANGAAVVVADLDAGRAHEQAARLAGQGGRALPVAVDVRDPQGVQRLVQRCVAEFGTLDALVNNAGITRDATLRTMTLEQWHDVLAVHLTAAFLGTQAAAAVMRARITACG